MHLQSIQNKIYKVRGQKVILDFDLAARKIQLLINDSKIEYPQPKKNNA